MHSSHWWDLSELLEQRADLRKRPRRCPKNLRSSLDGDQSLRSNVLSNKLDNVWRTPCPYEEADLNELRQDLIGSLYSLADRLHCPLLPSDVSPQEESVTNWSLKALTYPSIERKHQEMRILLHTMLDTDDTDDSWTRHSMQRWRHTIFAIPRDKPSACGLVVSLIEKCKVQATGSLRQLFFDNIRFHRSPQLHQIEPQTLTNGES